MSSARCCLPNFWAREDESGRRAEASVFRLGESRGIARVSRTGTECGLHVGTGNAAGKALYYARSSDDLVFADDSGLVVPALNGAPGVLSARYAGPGASNEQRIAKLLQEMSGLEGSKGSAHFVCVIAAARKNYVLAVVSEKVEGEIVKEPKGG